MVSGINRSRTVETDKEVFLADRTVLVSVGLEMRVSPVWSSRRLAWRVGGWTCDDAGFAVGAVTTWSRHVVSLGGSLSGMGLGS